MTPSLLEATIGMQTYPSTGAMYDASPARKWSGEVDFGVWWRTTPDRGELWRGSWISATSEFYIVKMRWPIVHVGSAADLPPAVFIIGTVLTREALEERLEGWAEVCGADDSLDWLIGRLVG